MNRGAVAIAAVFVLLAGVGGWFVLVSPPREQAADLQALIDTQETALTTAESSLVAAQADKAAYRAARAEVLRLGKAVPEDDDLQSLLIQLSATARQSGVRFAALERGKNAAGAVSTGASQTTTTPLPPGATVGTSGFPTVPLRLTFTGRYFGLTDFLAGLQAYVKTGRTISIDGRLLTLDGVKLTSSTPGSRTLEAVVSATAYLVSPAETAAMGASSAAPVGATSGAVSTSATPAPAGNG